MKVKFTTSIDPKIIELLKQPENVGCKSAGQMVERAVEMYINLYAKSGGQIDGLEPLVEKLVERAIAEKMGELQRWIQLQVQEKFNQASMRTSVVLDEIPEGFEELVEETEST